MGFFHWVVWIGIAWFLLAIVAGVIFGVFMYWGDGHDCMPECSDEPDRDDMPYLIEAWAGAA